MYEWARSRCSTKVEGGGAVRDRSEMMEMRLFVWGEEADGRKGSPGTLIGYLRAKALCSDRRNAVKEAG